MKICKKALEHNLDLCKNVRSKINTQVLDKIKTLDCNIELKLSLDDAITLHGIIAHYQETKGEE